MLTLHTWKTPASRYPAGPIGQARIESVPYDRGRYDLYGIRGHRYYRAARTLSIRQLIVGDKTWMVDDPPHWWAMQEHSTFYSGHVLVAGLGLGLIVHTLAQNPKVERITVIEREQDVIDLIRPHIPKCEIIHADFWDSDIDADGIFFDLFVGDGRQLIFDAMRVFLQLSNLYPLVRIHGFKNEHFQKLTDAVAEARRSCADRGRLLRDCSGRECSPVE